MSARVRERAASTLGEQAREPVARRRHRGEEAAARTRARGDVPALLEDAERFVQRAVRDVVFPPEVVFGAEPVAVGDLAADDGRFDFVREARCGARHSM
jgi:hypothetical protein